MKITVLGSYITKFGELWEQGLRNLLYEAIDGSLQDANLEPEAIEAVFVANKAAGNFDNQHHLNSLVSQYFPHFPPATRTEGACASGGLALLAAEHALLSGRYKTVLVVGGEKMSDASASENTRILSGAADVISARGSTFPGLYALLAQAHMIKFATTRKELSAVSVKNHAHALNNSKAQYQKKFTLDQVSNSVLVADPLRLLDCSPITDGAAAVILTTKKSKNKPEVLGFGQAQDTLDLARRQQLTTLKATTQAAKIAYEESSLRPSEIQVAEVHDCFTIAEIFAIEDLGFFDKGKGGSATLENKTTEGGEVVVNLSGGLKACGHPVGATGVKQLAYIAQLIEKDEYQYGLTHNVGGSGATAVVHVVGKGGVR